MSKLNKNKNLLTISDDQVEKALDEITKNAINKPVYLGNEKLTPVQGDTIVSPNDAQQDEILKMNQYRSKYSSLNGSGSTIVVLDTGIDVNHQMFGPDNNGDGIADRIVYQYDFANNDSDASDRNGHGSNVASIAAGSPTTYGNVTYTGIAPGANIIALKVFTDSGAGSFTYIEKALQWVVANAAAYNIVSVNMSIGDMQNWSVKAPRYGIGDELAALTNLGIVPVASSGNNFAKFGSAYGIAYPSSDPNSLSIGATYDSNSGSFTYASGAEANSTRVDQITPFSQRDPNLTTVFAPGAPITGANANGGLSTMHGTSQAAPVISGVVALAQQVALQRLGRRLTFDEMSNMLKSTGETIYDGDDEDDNVEHPTPPQAYKRIDMLALADAIMLIPTPTNLVHTLLATKVSVVEGNSGSQTVSFTITRSGAINSLSNVDYSLVGGATLGDDYTLQSVDGYNVMASGNTIYFTPGSTSATITLNVLGDVIDENNEDIIVNLSNSYAPAGSSIAGNNAKTTIVSDDPLNISVSDVTLTEVNSGTTNANFVVSLSNPSSQIITVRYAPQNITANNGTDYSLNGNILTFNIGETSKSVSFSVIGDTISEPDETFGLVLSNQNRGQLLKATGVGTILNDDPLPAIRINPASVTEGNSGTTNANFVVSLANLSSQNVTVNFNTVAGTATEGVDYTGTSGILTFAPGQMLRTISVAVNGDTDFEFQESFSLNISNPTNGTIVTSTATGTIANDDPIPAIDYSIVANNPTVTEGAPGNNNTLVSFLINRDNYTAIASSITYNLLGTAANWSDYQVVGVTGNGVTANSNTINFAPGATVGTLTLRMMGDSTFEADETINITLSNPSSNTATISTPSATTTITNDDPLPLIRVSPVTVTEGDSAIVFANFVLNVPNPSSSPITVDFNTLDGTADGDSDYVSTSGTVTFAPGQTMRTVSVAVNGDIDFEANETFSFNLSNAIGGSISTSSVLGTINNNDPVPGIDYSIVANNSTVTEGAAGNNNTLVSFLINRTNYTAITSSITYNLSGSAGNGSDYQVVGVTGNGVTASGNVVSFAPGATVGTLTLRVMGDNIFEPDEAINVTLSNPSSNTATISTPSASTTITNDDPLPVIRVNPVSVTESDSGVVFANFVLGISNPSSSAITVDFNTLDGTANAGSDYQATSGTVTFAPGQTMRTVSVAVNGDVDFEANETFSFNLSNAIGGSVGTASVLGTINNNDPVPGIDYSIVANNLTVTEGAIGTNTSISFLINRTNYTAITSSITYNLSGTAGNGSEYQVVGVTGNGVTTSGNVVSFAPGATVGTLTLRVIGDSTFEPDETLNVTLSNPSSNTATISTPSATTTITNDDPLPVISVNPVSVTEGDSGVVWANFVLSVPNASSSPITVGFNTVDGTANAGSDYVSTSGTVTFAPGQTMRTVSVAVNGDLDFEGNETFSLNLSNANGGSIGTTSVLGTIVNNDPVPGIDYSIVANNPTVTEGAAGNNTSISFLINRANYTAIASSIGYTIGGTAANWSDYQVVGVTGNGVTTSANVVNFAPGATVGTLTLRIVGDTTFEANETIDVTLSNPSSNTATISTPSATTTITNDDPLPVISVNPVSVTEGDSGVVFANFVLTVPNASSSAITVNFNTVDGSANAGSDYQATSGTVTFAPGQTMRTVSVAVNGDLDFEANETFSLNLSNAIGGSIGTTSVINTINNNDPVPGIDYSIVASNPTVTEGAIGTNTSISFLINRANYTAITSSVTYNLSGSAGNGSDYQVVGVSGNGVTASGSAVNFAPGATVGTLTVRVVGDTTFEADETINVTLSNPSSNTATISTPSATTTITNDDPLPVIRVNPVSVTESDSAVVFANFVLNVPNPSSSAITVNFNTVDGTADAGSDYVSTSGTVTFAPGQTMRTVSVAVNGDLDFEANETFSFNLSNANGGSIGTTSVLGTIVNNDPVPGIDYSVVASNPTVTEGAANNNTSISFLINRDNYTAIASSIGYTIGGTTANWSDYQVVGVTGNGVTTSANVVNFAPGATVGTLTLRVMGDTTFEADETINVTLSNPSSNTATISTPSATTTITNDDPLPVISANPVSVTEGDSAVVLANFVLTVPNASSSPITVGFNTVDGSANAGSDYQATSGTVTFAPGQTMRTVSVAVNGDLDFEANETFSLNLSNATGGSIGTTSIIGTINNNDPVPAIDYSIVASNPTVTEGAAGNNTSVSFLINRANYTAITSSVTYNLSGNAFNGSDYQVVGVTGNGVTTSGNAVNFAPGATVGTLTVRVVGDTTFEADETINVTLSNPSSNTATISTPSATTTIANDDPLPVIRVNPVSVTESDSAVVFANFVLNVPNPSSSAITVGFNTVDGTANADSDYVSTSGTVTFAPGQTMRTVSVAVNGDIDFEANETFSFNLSNATGGSIGTTSVVGTIVNNDPVPAIDYSVVASNPTVTEGAAGNNTSVSFLINRDNYTAIASSVRYDILGTAANWSDYQVVGVAGNGMTTSGNVVNFAPGATVGTLSLRVLGDTTFEADETINVRLSSPSTNTATLSNANAITTITNDDPLPTIRLNSAVVTEGNSGTVAMNFLVSLSNASSSPITADFTTADGTANAGSDYQATSGTITFAAGQLMTTVTVRVNGDTNYELTETLNLNLTNAVGGNLNTTSVVGTINNDDLTLTGSLAADVLVGRSENNTIKGGAGADTLTGGAGNDNFVYNTLDDQGDLITDFRAGQDKIVLTNLLATIGYTGTNPIADGVLKFTASGSNTVVSLDLDGMLTQSSAVPFLTLQNVSLANINNLSNFVL